MNFDCTLWHDFLILAKFDTRKQRNLARKQFSFQILKYLLFTLVIVQMKSPDYVEK